MTSLWLYLRLAGPIKIQGTNSRDISNTESVGTLMSSFTWLRSWTLIGPGGLTEGRDT